VGYQNRVREIVKLCVKTMVLLSLPIIWFLNQITGAKVKLIITKFSLISFFSILLRSISSTFYGCIFCTKVIHAAFFNLHLTREKLPKKLLYEKGTLKTLMKLTPGCLIEQVCSLHSLFNLSRKKIVEERWGVNFVSKCEVTSRFPTISKKALLNFTSTQN